MALVGYIAGIGRTYTDEDVDVMYQEPDNTDIHEGNLIAASEMMKAAVEHLDKAIDIIMCATDEVYEVPEAMDVLNDCYEGLLSIRGYMNRKRDDYSRGVR